MRRVHEFERLAVRRRRRPIRLALFAANASVALAVSIRPLTGKNPKEMEVHRQRVRLAPEARIECQRQQLASVEAGSVDLAAIETLVAGFPVQVVGGSQGRPAHPPAAADEDGKVEVRNGRGEHG